MEGIRSEVAVCCVEPGVFGHHNTTIVLKHLFVPGRCLAGLWTVSNARNYQHDVGRLDAPRLHQFGTEMLARGCNQTEACAIIEVEN